MALPPDDNDPDDSGDNDVEQDENSFAEMLKSFSNEWLHVQLTHHVSLSATNAFWGLTLKHFQQLMDLKEAEGIKRKIPQFGQVRKNIYKDLCPDITMTVAYLNKTDNTIIRVNVDATTPPLSHYQRDNQYKKLYEEAHIEVKKCFLIFFPF